MAGYTKSAGDTEGDARLLRLSASGEKEASTTFGQKGLSDAFDALVPRGTGFVAAGYTSSCGAKGEDFYLVNLDATGAPTCP